mgnify:CR=1 FL=1
MTTPDTARSSPCTGTRHSRPHPDRAGRHLGKATLVSDFDMQRTTEIRLLRATDRTVPAYS